MIKVDPSQLIVTFEKTLEDISHEFYGEGAFNFATEADVQATLMGKLRANVLFHVREGITRRELVHSEYRAFGTSWKGQPSHDLTVLHPELVTEAREFWGTPPQR